MDIKNIIKYSYLLAFVLINAAAFRCNSSTPKTNEYANSYFPIAKGNYWKYVNEAPRDETILYEVKVTDSQITDNFTKITVSSFPYLTKESKTQTLQQKSAGEIEAVDYMGSTGIFVPAAGNFRKGFSWNFGTFQGMVNDEKINITTEAGAFSGCCYILITDGFTFSFEMWYKKDVGIVRWGANRTNPPTIKPEYFVLKEFNIN